MRAQSPRQLFGLIRKGHNDLRFVTGLKAQGGIDLLCQSYNSCELVENQKLVSHRAHRYNYYIFPLQTTYKGGWGDLNH